MRFSMLALLGLGLSAMAFAGSVESQGKVAKTVAEIPVYGEALVTSPPAAAPTKLQLTGACERIKTVVFVHAHVYVLASYADTKTVDAANPMKTFEKSKTKALKLTFVRNVGAGKIRESFEESLEKNGADVKAAPIATMLKQMDVDVKEHETLSIVGVDKANGTQEVLVEFPSKTVKAEGKGLADAFWKIWYGEPTDGGLKDLKNCLLGQAS